MLHPMSSHPLRFRRGSLRIASRLLVVPAILSAGSCAIGPDYHRPTAAAVEEFAEARDWKQAAEGTPLEAGRWWSVFNDPQLDELEAQVEPSNQNLKLAEAQLRQSLALARQAEAGLWPMLGSSIELTRSQHGNALANGTVPGTSQSSSGKAETTRTLQLTASWEFDLWGGVRRSIEEARANTAASRADLAAARLSLQAELAIDYFELRSADATAGLLQSTLKELERSLDITQRQYDVGVVSRGDVLLARTQLSQTRAQLVDLGLTRRQLEHAIALLLGRSPSQFSLPPSATVSPIPAIPVGIPSDLLERRPDIAAAERRVAAANAQIGVASAAYFPNLTLFAGSGYQNLTSAPWISAPNFFWSVGPTLAGTLFTGGRIRAQNAQARAEYDATVATYRQTVLQSFRDVEDNIAALKVLADESVVQDETVRLAQDLVAVATKQYKAGTVTYLTVATAQATALANARTTESIRSRRLVAAVALIRALGGGWDSRS
jgi:NodT family efflux transporter outer membrane factor (OMF) lipoprotein